MGDDKTEVKIQVMNKETEKTPIPEDLDSCCCCKCTGCCLCRCARWWKTKTDPEGCCCYLFLLPSCFCTITYGKFSNCGCRSFWSIMFILWLLVFIAIFTLNFVVVLVFMIAFSVCLAALKCNCGGATQ